MEPGPTETAVKQSAPRQIGRFLLTSELGSGATGRVYLADDPLLERQVALKVAQVSADEPELSVRFAREAKAVARLRHPSIVPLFEGGACGDFLYIAAEYVPGKTLARLLTDGPPPELRQAVDWVRQISLALDYAHSEGIIHRDVKPANILLEFGAVPDIPAVAGLARVQTPPRVAGNPSGQITRNHLNSGEFSYTGQAGSPHSIAAPRPRLIDFGLAKSLADDPELTAEGTLLGTPAYLSPEQARGDLPAIGPASDQYSLGVVLYELLTGRVPFDGPPHLIVPQILSQEPVFPRRLNRTIPRDLQVICLKCLSKSPADRYGSCGELAADLGHWLAGETIAARQAPAWESTWRWARRNRLVTALGGAVAVLMVAIAVISAVAGWRVSRDRAGIAQAYREAVIQQQTRQEQARVAREQLQIVERQTQLAAAHAREVLDAQTRIRETMAELEVESQRLDEVVQRREAQLQKIAESQQQGQADAEETQRTKLAATASSSASRGNSTSSDPLTNYAEKLRAAALAIASADNDEALARLNDCQPEHRHWEWHFLRSRCENGAPAHWTVANVPIEYSAPPKFDNWRDAPGPADQATLRSYYDAYFGRRVQRYVAFNPSGSLLACIAEKRRINLFDAGSGNLSRVLTADSKSASGKTADDSLRLFAVTFSHDGRSLAAISEHEIVFWKVDQEAAVRTHRKSEMFNISCHPGPDDRIPIVTWTVERKSRDLFSVRIFDAQTGRDWHGLTAAAKNALLNLRDLSVTLSNDRRVLVVRDRIHVKQSQDLIEISRIDLVSGAIESQPDPKAMHSTAPFDPILAEPVAKPAARSPDGRRLIDDRGICAAQTGLVLIPLAELLDVADLVDDDSPYAFDWSSDGTRIAVKIGTGVCMISIPAGAIPVQ